MSPFRNRAHLPQEAFGPATFYVTETRLGGATDMTTGTILTMGGGLLVRGNLRTSATEAFEFADAAIQRMFGAQPSANPVYNIMGLNPGDGHTYVGSPGAYKVYPCEWRCLGR